MPLRFSACLLILATVLIGSHRRATAATPEEVDQAIEKAKEYLFSIQNKDGDWEIARKMNPAGGIIEMDGKQWGGNTSMVCYAVLAAGESSQAPRMTRALELLKRGEIIGTYATALRCQVWLLMDDSKKLRLQLDRDYKSLQLGCHLENGKEKEDYYGFYTYYSPVIPGAYDRSCSQYGVLGMWALDQAGVEVPTRYWQIVDTAWRRGQNADGGWSYTKSAGAAGSSPTMTAAGIATLFITQDYTLGNLAECKGNITNVNIEHGLAWMDKHIAQALGSGFYGMYGIERIGVASGRKYFGTVNWYETGANAIVRAQGKNGAWGDIPNTCFALLFLCRGRAPVVMNKVEYSSLERNGKIVEGPWNERPRDCANFARWMGRSIEHDLNWQVVNLKVGPEDLHDAPILYITGDNELNFSDVENATLRTFVEQGGLILGNADCGRPAFSTSFVKLGHKLFPKYEFRDLAPNHIIFTDQQFRAAKWKTKPKLKGLSNGVREMMLLVPDADLSRAFQGRNEKTRDEVYQLAANIFLYAIDKKNLQNKGDTYIIQEKPTIKTTRDLTLARLQVGENPNPEPGGWRRLGALLHNADKIALTVKDVKLEPDALKGIKVAHLTGTTAFKLGDDQRNILKDFIDGGGTLIIDAAGGSPDFADSAETELAALFGPLPDALPPAALIYNFPDAKIEAVRYRTFAKKTVGNIKTPRIRAYEMKGRLAVFYSREDLSAGIVGEPVDGITGYEPGYSTALMRNIVVFSGFGFPPPPTTKPTTKPATNPTTKPTTKPATQVATQPAVPATTQPATPAPTGAAPK